MIQTKIISINKKLIAVIAQFALLLGIATIAPLFHFQPITGPIVNAALFLSIVLLGIQSAVLLALIPSVIALSSGLLPAALAPAVPFIMLSNIVLIFVFSFLRKKNFWLAIISASTLKFLFLFSSSYLVVNLISQKPIAQKAAAMLSYPQLLTALSGGLITCLILQVIKKKT